MDVHSTANDAQMAIDKAKTVRTQNLPTGTKRRCAGMVDGFRSHADTLTTRKDAHNIAHNVGMAENHVGRWRWVSADSINVNILLNEVPDTAS